MFPYNFAFSNNHRSFNQPPNVLEEVVLLIFVFTICPILSAIRRNSWSEVSLALIVILMLFVVPPTIFRDSRFELTLAPAGKLTNSGPLSPTTANPPDETPPLANPGNFLNFLPSLEMPLLTFLMASKIPITPLTKGLNLSDILSPKYLAIVNPAARTTTPKATGKAAIPANSNNCATANLRTIKPAMNNKRTFSPLKIFSLKEGFSKNATMKSPTNLKPATIFGNESYGMLLAAKKRKTLTLVTVDDANVSSGMKVY